MATLADLVPRALEPGPAGDAAVQDLVAAGPAVIDAVMAHVRRRMTPAPPVLLRVIADGAGPAGVPPLLALLDDPHFDVQRTAYLALGTLGDRRATGPIVERLVDPELGSAFALEKGTALTLLRDPDSRAPLRALVAGWLAGGRAAALTRFNAAAREGTAADYLWPIMTAAALAAVGDHEHDQLAYDLIGQPKAAFKPVTGGTAMFPSLAAELRHFAAPGLLAAIDAALKGASSEARQTLARVLGALGTREALERLVELAQAKDAPTAGAAAYWLVQVGGADLPDDQPARPAATWWKKSAKAFPSGVVHADGRPWTAAAVLSRVAAEGDLPDADVRLTLGLDLGQERRRRKLSRARTIAAVAVEHESLPPGRLYRYGTGHAPPGS